MTTRRSFLEILAAGAATTALAQRARAAAGGKPPLGLQLYSLRDQLKKDVPGTLKQVRDWGFEEIEAYTDFGPNIAGAIKDAGLRCSAMHVGYDQLSKDMSGVLKGADALGVRTLINPYLPHKTRPFASREEIQKAAEDFASFSTQCRAAGKRFAYHIHGQEFGPAPEGTLFDVLAKESGPEVGFEADVFWVTVGGGDPVKLMAKYPGRFWFTHLKDMSKTAPPSPKREEYNDLNVVLGTGKIDIKGVVAAGAKAGVEMHYIEDESSSVLTQVPQSMAYYKSL
jgi:sugar phosphate isomerase/epimerase